MTRPLIDTMTDEHMDRTMAVMKGMAHPIRFRIVVLLCERDHTVTEMSEALAVRQASISQHLSPLRLLGLVAVDRTGDNATYTLQEPMLRNLVDCFLSHCGR